MVRSTGGRRARVSAGTGRDRRTVRSEDPKRRETCPVVRRGAPSSRSSPSRPARRCGTELSLACLCTTWFVVTVASSSGCCAAWPVPRRGYPTAAASSTVPSLSTASGNACCTDARSGGQVPNECPDPEGERLRPREVTPRAPIGAQCCCVRARFCGDHAPESGAASFVQTFGSTLSKLEPVAALSASLVAGQRSHAPMSPSISTESQK
jgi:hypothetical protein